MIASLLLAGLLSAAPTKALSIDAGGVASAARFGDVVVPVEYELPLWSRLHLVGRAHVGVGTGAAGGLFGIGLRAGIRWRPFSDDLGGFWLGLNAGGDLVVASQPTLFGLRPSAGIGLGYTCVVFDRAVISPAVEFTPFGYGFPIDALALRFGIGLGF